MAQLINFGKKVSLEEFIKAQVCANNGTWTRVQASDLHDILDKLNVQYKKTTTKDKLLDLIYEQYKDWNKIAEILKIGVKLNQYTDAFPFVSNADIKRLEKFGQLKVIGYETFRAYGDYKYAPLYDLVQFQNMTEPEMKELLLKFPKGMRMKKAK